jgi:hypothetical protein
MLMALLGVKASAWASTAKPTSPASMATSELASSQKAVLWDPAPTSSRATSASSSTSAAGWATTMTRPTTVRLLSTAAGFIRNTQDSRPSPVAMMAASIRLARSLPGVRARMSSTSPAASGRYPAR